MTVDGGSPLCTELLRSVFKCAAFNSKKTHTSPETHMKVTLCIRAHDAHAFPVEPTGYTSCVTAFVKKKIYIFKKEENGGRGETIKL